MLKLLTTKPDPDLHWYINKYTSLTFDNTSRIKYYPHGDYRLPDSFIRISFHYSDSIPWIEIGGVNSVQPRSNIRGLQSKPLIFNTGYDTNVFSIEFTPPGFSSIFNMPCKALDGMPVELDLVGSIQYRNLHDQLQKLTVFSEKVSFLNSYFIKKLNPKYESDKAFSLYKFMKCSKNALSVDELASKAFYSDRHLRRFFDHWFGISPKQYLRLARFEKTVSEMGKFSSKKKVETALEAGYYDQSHFSNDIKYFSGMTPIQLQSFISKKATRSNNNMEEEL